MRSNRCKQCTYTIWVETAIIDKILLRCTVSVHSVKYEFSYSLQLIVHWRKIFFCQHESQQISCGKIVILAYFFINFEYIPCWWNESPKAFLWKYFERVHFNIIVLVKRQNYFFMSDCQGKYTRKNKVIFWNVVYFYFH